MRKTIKNLFTIISVLVILFALTSCAFMGETPELDLEEAKENLDDNDYLVTYYDEDYDFKNGSANVLEKIYAYSADSDSEDFVSITKYKDSQSALLALREVKVERDIQIKYLKAQIKYYEHLLEEYEDDMDIDEVEELEEELEEYEDMLEILQDDYVYGIDGNYVWYGTIDAIDDTK